MLDHLHDWCNKWRMVVNFDKSEIVHYRPKIIPLTDYNFTLGQLPLRKVKVYKYLGVHLSEHLEFNVTETILAESAGRALSSIMGTFKNLGNLGYRTYTSLYDNGVIPVMDYGSEIWGFSTNQKGPVIQNRAMRYFLGVHRFAPNAAIQGDMGWLGCESRRRLSMLRFWNRLVKTNQSRLVKKVFVWDHSQRQAGSWSQEVAFILNSINLMENFENRLPVNLDQCKQLFKGKEEQTWLNEISRKPKLRTYEKFKNTLETEPYVIKNLSRSERSVMAQLRTGILPLRIETGRWACPRLLPEERLCQVCNSGSVEDEVHFIFKCQNYLVII